MRINGYHPFYGLLIIMVCMTGCREQKKLGYIDTAVLLNKFDRAAQVRSEIQTATTQWQAEAQEMGQSLDSLRQRYINDHAGMSSAEQQRLRTRIADRELEYNRFMKALNQKAAGLEAEKLQPVFQELNGILKEYGKTRGYDIIWGTTPDGNIVYADSSANLTDDVLTYIHHRPLRDDRD